MDLRIELLRRMAVDQEGRHALEGIDDWSRPEARALAEQMMAIDIDNTAWLRDVVDADGWPRRSVVGDDGALAAWLLAQHADQDPELQRGWLALVEQLPAGEVDPGHVAYLTDRVRLAFDEPQVYGTQVDVRDGVASPRDLEDPDGVDTRRAAVGLGPLQGYLDGFRTA